MSLVNIIQFVCLQQESTKEIINVAVECNEIADQANLLCTAIQDEKINSMISTTQNISSDMRNLGSNDDNNDNDQENIDRSGGDRKLFDGKLIQKIQKFIDQSKTKQIIDSLNDINNDSQVLHEKISNMSSSIERGINSLPSNVQENYKSTEINEEQVTMAIQHDKSQQQERGINDNNVDLSMMGQEERDLIDLLNIDTDMNELETTCQRSAIMDDSNERRFLNFDFFKTGTLSGSAIYEEVQQKGIKCKGIVQQMRTLCTTISNLMHAFMNGNCCIQSMAIISNIGNLFRCRNILLILQKAIQAIQKMISTIINVLKRLGEKIQRIFKEFIAAKKIGTFVGNVLQKNDKVKDVVTNIGNSIQTVTNIFDHRK